MADKRNLLLEIGTEELPAGFLFPALKELEELARKAFAEKRLGFDSVTTFGTPRRMALLVDGLETRQPDITEKITGPAARIAFDENGEPTKAGIGFARSKGLDVADLRTEKTEKGEYVVAERLIAGQDTTELLPGILPEIIESVHFPKSMRWADHELRFARPIRWIVALFGNEVVDFTVAGVRSGAESRGHRFMAPQPVRLEPDAARYLDKMSESFVMADPDARRSALLESALEAARSAGGNLLEDSELLDLNTNLVEFPSAVCGRFDKHFLSLPECVLITCMKEHQKYFAVQDDSGRLMPNFVAINNTRSDDPELVTTGHQRVLRARLSDADFFFQEDRKRPLEDFVPELAGMVFHRKLGTLLDKTRRIQALAEYIAAETAPEHLETSKRAAWLCKADLLSEMVGEFPTLQGVMGREYARLSGEPEDVAIAIEEHYMPVKSGAPLPETVPGSIISLADKTDTICSTFAIGLRPSGTQDPYALRRLALGILHILEQGCGTGFAVSLRNMVSEAVDVISKHLPELQSGLRRDILAFFRARLVNDLISRGLDSDIVEAAVRSGFYHVRDCVERAHALKAVRGREEFEPISVAFKRVMNILKEYEGGMPVSSSLFEASEEKELFEAYQQVKERLSPLLGKSEDEPVDREDYEKALIILLSLKPQIDNFFDNVMVMADDMKTRENRLALLWHVSRLFLKIGDLSAISGE